MINTLWGAVGSVWDNFGCPDSVEHTFGATSYFGTFHNPAFGGVPVVCVPGCSVSPAFRGMLAVICRYWCRPESVRLLHPRVGWDDQPGQMPRHTVSSMFKIARTVSVDAWKCSSCGIMPQCFEMVHSIWHSEFASKPQATESERPHPKVGTRRVIGVRV